MGKIILVAETGSDITKDLAKQYGIEIVPMHVSFENETLDDGSFSVKKIINYYKRTGKLPKTSGCNPGDFTIFDRIHQEHPKAHILYLAYSAITTCSYQSASIMAEGKDYITLLDTKQVSIGQGAIVIEIAKYLQNNPNATIEEVVEAAKQMINRTRMCFIPNHLEFLRAGGRVNNAAYLGATILNLHPLIEILDGKLIATKKYRGKMSRICLKVLKEYTELYDLDKDVLWLVYTIGLSDDIKRDINNIVHELGYKDIYWVLAHGVITTHGGPSAFGLAGFSKKK